MQGDDGERGRLSLVEKLVRLENNVAFGIQPLRPYGVVFLLQGADGGLFIKKDGGGE